jgi:hypothetical protein
MLRYRRNVNCLTADQLHDFREALAILFSLPASSPHSWAYVAGLHGLPAPTWCIHGAPGFLTWHRAYLLALEEALQCLNPAVTVPYWNWSSAPTTGVPAACASPTYVDRDGDTVANPLYAGPLPPGAGAAMTSRRSDIDTTSFADLATAAQAALANADFDDFQNELNSVHGGVHVRVGGNMGSVPYAGFDPIFFLHHANVDRLWAQWQGAHSLALPSAEAGLSLDPFVKPCSTAMYTGADMGSTQALGYRYLNFCVTIIGPIVLTPIRLKLEPWVREGLQRAKLVLRGTRMASTSMDIRVFVNDPKANERTPFLDNPRFAGSFGVFGMKANVAPARGKRPARAAGRGQAQMRSSMRGDRFDLQIDITAALTPALSGRSAPTLTLVPVGPDGRRVPKESLDFDRLELMVE